MPLIVFRSRLKAGVDLAAYDAHVAEIYGYAEKMPGFVSIKDFASPDGERLALIEFESHAELEAWRDHPEHRKAQAAGRERYYTDYSLEICDVVRTSRFPG